MSRSTVRRRWGARWWHIEMLVGAWHGVSGVRVAWIVRTRDASAAVLLARSRQNLDTVRIAIRDDIGTRS
jgi:hypothetical protein